MTTFLRASRPLIPLMATKSRTSHHVGVGPKSDIALRFRRCPVLSQYQAACRRSVVVDQGEQYCDRWR